MRLRVYLLPAIITYHRQVFLWCVGPVRLCLSTRLLLAPSFGEDAATHGTLVLVLSHDLTRLSIVAILYCLARNPVFVFVPLPPLSIMSVPSHGQLAPCVP